MAAQHSQTLESWFVHAPGLVVIMPSTPYDAKGLLKSAIRDDNPVVFLEKRLLYSRRGPVPEEEYTVPIGVADVKREGSDVTVVDLRAGRAPRAAGGAPVRPRGSRGRGRRPAHAEAARPRDARRLGAEDGPARRRHRGGAGRQLRERGRRPGGRRGLRRAALGAGARDREGRADALCRSARARSAPAGRGRRRRASTPRWSGSRSRRRRRDARRAAPAGDGRAGRGRLFLRLPENVMLATGWWVQIGGLGIVVVPREGAATLLIPEYEAAEARSVLARRHPHVPGDPLRRPAAGDRDPAAARRSSPPSTGSRAARSATRGATRPPRPRRSTANRTPSPAPTQALIRSAFCDRPARRRHGDARADQGARRPSTTSSGCGSRTRSRASGSTRSRSTPSPAGRRPRSLPTWEPRSSRGGHGYQGTRVVRAYPTVWSGPETAVGWQYFRSPRPADRAATTSSCSSSARAADGYWADHTRTVVAGKASERQREAMAAVFAAQRGRVRRARGRARPAARSTQPRARPARPAGSSSSRTTPATASASATTSRGRCSTPGSEHVLEAGMAIVTEPGVYEQGLGGFRWEDNAVVTAGRRACGSRRRTMASTDELWRSRSSRSRRASSTASSGWTGASRSSPAAGSGLGAAMAKGLAQAGAALAIVDVERRRGGRDGRHDRGAGRQRVAMHCDVTDKAAGRRARRAGRRRARPRRRPRQQRRHRLPLAGRGLPRGGVRPDHRAQPEGHVSAAARPSAGRCSPRAPAASSTSPRSAPSSPIRTRAPTTRARAACST